MGESRVQGLGSKVGDYGLALESRRFSSQKGGDPAKQNKE